MLKEASWERLLRDIIEDQFEGELVEIGMIQLTDDLKKGKKVIPVSLVYSMTHGISIYNIKYRNKTSKKLIIKKNVIQTNTVVLSTLLVQSVK